MKRISIVLGLCLALVGCSDSGGDGSGDDGRDGGASLDSGGGGGGDGGDGPSGDGGGRSDAGSGRVDAGPPSEEVCDGIDNDRNGIVDDVDVAGDGVCDCLVIGTLGTPGPWGAGNVFAEWLSERSSFPVVTLGDAEITAERLAPLHILVAQDIRGRAYSEAEVRALEAWIRGGGGLFTMTGYGDASERTNINHLLTPIGIAYDSAPILAGSPTVPIQTWHAHPVSEGVMRVGVDNGYAVVGEGTPVAEERGFVVLRARALDEGHVLVWGDEWIAYDSEWTDHPDYQVERFWLNAFKWLTRAGECQVPILL